MSLEKTYFAPAERAGAVRLKSQIELFANNDYQHSIGNALPLIFLILNTNRQVVYANDRVLEALGAQEFSCVLGRRVGEIFHCVHSTKEAGGCGTSRFCENCGAVNAMLQAQAGVKSIKECRLTMEGELSADYRVWATPHVEQGESFIFFTLQDIQHEKRRQALERTFFHDILNTAGGISGLTEALSYIDDENEKEELLDMLDKSAHRLVEEIQSGRALSMAENGDLQLSPKQFDLRELIVDTASAYKNSAVVTGKRIDLDVPEQSINIVSDPAIVGRVFSNLIKNALEASEDGGVVRVRSIEDADSVTVAVNNVTVMSPEVSAQIFQRSFSTKGSGRGIGTYSIRLFTEKYLNGQVWFTSELGSGTSFYIKLNK